MISKWHSNREFLAVSHSLVVHFVKYLSLTKAKWKIFNYYILVINSLPYHLSEYCGSLVL